MRYVQIDRSVAMKKYRNMMNRCYNKKVQARKPYYKGVIVCEQWKNDADSFVDWVNDNYYEIEGEKTVELDHDILEKGSKIYSPETCIFAPQRINSMFGGSHNKRDGSLPTGVVEIKKGIYKPQVPGYNSSFDNVEEAWEIYKRYKEARIINIAQEYKGRIPDKLYKALWNWKVEITD